jgi:hypothetical protein
VQVIEIAPPLTRTTLMGSGTDNDNAMPLDDLLSETMALLESQPDARQILVQCVKRSASPWRTAPTTRSRPCRRTARTDRPTFHRSWVTLPLRGKRPTIRAP